MDNDRWASRDDDREPVVYVSHDRGIPSDAQRMGLDRNTEEGALIAMAGSLDSAKPLHRIVAWALLAAFCLPLVITLWHEFL
jgi:uncharacterized protein (UPF0248 family)